MDKLSHAINFKAVDDASTLTQRLNKICSGEFFEVEREGVGLNACVLGYFTRT